MYIIWIISYNDIFKNTTRTHISVTTVPHSNYKEYNKILKKNFFYDYRIVNMANYVN